MDSQSFAYSLQRLHQMAVFLRGAARLANFQGFGTGMKLFVS
jgi:hypothetical protein